MRHALVITAAGKGERFGGDKVLERIGEGSVLGHCLDRVWGTGIFSECVVVGSEAVLAAVSQMGISGLRGVLGGTSRFLSVKNGVLALGDCDVVWVHDAARPLVSQGLIERLLDRIQGCDAVIPGVAVRDTLKRVDGGRVRETVDREGLMAVETPQVFSYALLKAAYEKIGDEIFTDEAGLFEFLGHDVAVVEGDVQNIKLTYPGDLEMIRSLLK